MTELKLGTAIKNIVATINANFAELAGKSGVTYKVLFSGIAAIPSNSDGTTSTIALNADVTQFDGIIIQREGSSCWEHFDTIGIGSKFKVMNCEADFDMMEGCNLYMCNAEVISGTQLRVSNNVYAGIKTSAAGRYLTSFTERPITKIIGIKLN